MIELNWSDKKFVSLRDTWDWGLKEPRVWWCYSYSNQKKVSILKVVPAYGNDPMGRDDLPLLVRPGHVDPEVYKPDIILALLGNDIVVIDRNLAYDEPLPLPSFDL